MANRFLRLGSSPLAMREVGTFAWWSPAAPGSWARRRLLTPGHPNRWDASAIPKLDSQMEAKMERRGERIVESSVEARQGLLGKPVPVVLVVSCTLAVVALALSFADVFGHA
jgi:hypothetical protein